MATLTRGISIGATETITNTKLQNLVDLGSVNNIVDADIDSAANIADTKLRQITTVNKVSGTAIGNLASIPSSAGIFPINNLPSVLTSIASIPNNSLLPITLSSWVDGSAMRNIQSMPSMAGQLAWYSIVSSLASGASPVFNGTDKFVGGNASSLKLISTTTVAASSTTGNISIVAGNSYLVKYNIKNFASAQIPILRFNADSSSNYDFVTNGFNTAGTAMTTNGATQTGINLSKAVFNNANAGITGFFYIDCLGGGNVITQINGSNTYFDNASSLIAYVSNGGRWSNTGAVTSFSIIAGGNFDALVYLYKLELV